MYTKDNIELAKKTGTIEKVYGDIVNQLVRKKYNLSEELSFIRQRHEKPEEFSRYSDFVEECKAEAKKLCNI